MRFVLHSGSECCEGQIYREWIQTHDSWTSDDEIQLRALLKEICVRPRFLIVPLSFEKIDNYTMAASVTSLQAQIYDNWRIVVPSGTELALSNERIVVSRTLPSLPRAALATAVSHDDADFVVLIPAGALLAPQALAQFVIAIAECPEAELIFGDEDSLSDGVRLLPWFKTDWDPFLALARDVVGVPACYRRDKLAPFIGLLRAAPVDNLLHELALSFASTAAQERIIHIPFVLCHRTHERDWKCEVAVEVVRNFLYRTGQNFIKVGPAPLAPQWNRIEWKPPAPERLVSILIPTRDKADLLERCVDGLLTKTSYRNLEIILIDNGTQQSDALRVLRRFARDQRVRIIRDDRPFNFSVINNDAAAQARGEMLLFLNNDTEVLHEDWLDELVSLVCLPQVGVVGAKLLYSDRRIQHAGIGFGPDNLVWHLLQGAGQYEPGPFGELALTRQASAVTGACLMVRREVFIEAQGFDEAFVVSYQDVDFCRRVARLGYAILYTPHAQLLHLEGATRGVPNEDCASTAREFVEMVRFWERNPEFYDQFDPFLSPNMALERPRARFARPPRRARPWEKRSSMSLEPFFY